MNALVERLDPEARAYVERLEKIAREGDAERCDGCSLVFACDDGEFGDECFLCKSCVAAAREEYRRTLARAVAAGEACTCVPGTEHDGCSPHLRNDDCTPLALLPQRSAPAPAPNE